MLKLELIADINRIITHRISKGVKKCCTRGNSIDARKFRIYGFVDKNLEGLYNLAGLPPTSKFYYSYETGEIWVTNPDIDHTLIENQRLADISKSIHKNRAITRVNMIAFDNFMPDADHLYKMLEPLADELTAIYESSEDNTIDKLASFILVNFMKCFTVIKNRLDGDNNNKTGNYGYNKKFNCLYRKPAKQRSIKRGKFSE